MIKIEKTKIEGFEPAIRGMRNPMNSWDKSDSTRCSDFETECKNCGYDNENGIPCPVVIGSNDMKLMRQLRNSGTDHGKFMRMIVVWCDVTAPLYWWKEFDTYKVGTVANSCSTMHKIHAKEFTIEDFSYDKLITDWIHDNCELFIYGEIDEPYSQLDVLEFTICALNTNREAYLKTKNKKYWWQMIQLLPSSYNQKRTVMLNYEVIRTMYHARKSHKLDEWHDFCRWVESLPYAKELIVNE